METIVSKGKVLDVSIPRIMGILNMTPDSFYDGGERDNLAISLNKVAQMIEDGASIIDVGGMSSRPGAKEIPEEVEIGRVVPIIREIRLDYPEIMISIDTFRAGVAAASLDAGADIVNDISAGELDKAMIDLVAEREAPYIIMHMKGRPENMQENPAYQDVVTEVIQYLLGRLEICHKKGIRDVIIDPGFGFGKTLEHNFSLLNKLEVFSILEHIILVGLSRKSMIYKTTGGEASDALVGTAAAHMVALQKGARILRVHDVKATADVIAIWEKLKERP